MALYDPLSAGQAMKEDPFRNGGTFSCSAPSTTPKRFVYLAGPIADRTYSEAAEWRLHASAILTANGFGVYNPVALTPPCKKPNGDLDWPNLTTEQIRCLGETDLRNITNSWALLARVPMEGYGTSAELGYAAALGKKIVIMDDQPWRISEHAIFAAIRASVMPENLMLAVERLVSFRREEDNYV